MTTRWINYWSLEWNLNLTISNEYLGQVLHLDANDRAQWQLKYLHMRANAQLPERKNACSQRAGVNTINVFRQ